MYCSVLPAKCKEYRLCRLQTLHCLSWPEGKHSRKISHSLCTVVSPPANSVSLTASSSMAHICVVLGSVREGRQGLRVARMIINNLEQLGARTTLLDPLEINPPMLQQPLHFMKDQSEAPQWMLDTHRVIQECSGMVVVTPEYNCSLPPALTNLLDYFPPASYRHKPASIACYSMGPYGGMRAGALARPFLSELGLVPLPTILCIPTIQNAGLPEDGIKVDNERVVRNTEKLCKEVLWYVEALGEKKEKEGNPN